MDHFENQFMIQEHLRNQPKHDRTDKTIQDNGNLVNPWDRIDFESLSKISSLAPNYHLSFSLYSDLCNALQMLGIHYLMLGKFRA